MKALSVRQPWANMIASGEKTIETRTWSTKYRGVVLICSSKSPVNPGPSGCALALARLTDCRPMTKDDEEAACCEVYPNAYSWVLADVLRLDRPFPIKGKLGLFEVPEERLEQLRRLWTGG